MPTGSPWGRPATPGTPSETSPGGRPAHSNAGRPPSLGRIPMAHASKPTDGLRAERPTPMSMAERGRLGGLATVARYGTEHMRRIGRRGFSALAGRFGKSRRLALEHLDGKGRMEA